MGGIQTATGQMRAERREGFAVGGAVRVHDSRSSGGIRGPFMRQEGRLFCRGLFFYRFLINGWCRPVHRRVREREAFVVKALTQKHYIGKSIIDCQDRHRRENSLQDRPKNVEDIAEEPDDDEDEGKAIGGGAAEVFYYLRGVDDDPAGYGNRTTKRQITIGRYEGMGSLTRRCRLRLRYPSEGPAIVETWRQQHGVLLPRIEALDDGGIMERKCDTDDRRNVIT